jgi:hypothetical protein
MKKQTRKLSRKFLGNLFPEKKDANFEKAHLKAYLQGRYFFRFGFKVDEETGLRMPAFHEVKQEYFVI